MSVRLIPGRWRPLANTGKPTQPSLRGLGSICKVDIGGKPGNGFCQLMMKIGQAAQSTGWIVSSQCRVQAAQSTGWIVSSQRQFFRSWEGPGTGGQVVAAPWATCPSVGWDLNLNQLCARPGMGEMIYDRSTKSQLVNLFLQSMQSRDVLRLQSMQSRDVLILQTMCGETYYFSPGVHSRTTSVLACRDVLLQSRLQTVQSLLQSMQMQRCSQGELGGEGRNQGDLGGTGCYRRDLGGTGC